MDIEPVLNIIDQIDQGGPGTKGPNGENSAVLMSSIIGEPGAGKALVDRYGGSSNDITISNVAGSLIDLAEKPTSDTVNLIYELLERAPNWDDSWTANHALLTIRSQTINGMAWDPAERTPPVLSRFLLNSLGLEADDENDNADTAVNVLWVIHQWAANRGGLRSVFSPEERQAFRDTFDEVGLEPKPILEALGED